MAKIFFAGGNSLSLFYPLPIQPVTWLMTKITIIPESTPQMSNAATRPSPNIFPIFNDHIILELDRMPTPASIFSQLLIKLQTSLLKIQCFFLTNLCLGVVDIRYRIQSLQTHAVLLANLHELRTHNQFVYLALTNNSYQYLHSHNQKS